MNLSTERTKIDRYQTAQNKDFFSSYDQFSTLKKMLLVAFIALLFSGCGSSNGLLQRGPVDKAEDAIEEGVEAIFLGKELARAGNDAYNRTRNNSYKPLIVNRSSCTYRVADRYGKEMKAKLAPGERAEPKVVARDHKAPYVIVDLISDSRRCKDYSGTIESNREQVVIHDRIIKTTHR